jgi:hypothetical protein
MSYGCSLPQSESSSSKNQQAPLGQRNEAMSNIQNVVREWAWVTAMQNNPSVQTYHLEANKSLLFSYLHSQEMLVNPRTVSEALMFALQHGDRLENGFELCVKTDERLVADQAAQAAAEQKKREESLLASDAVHDRSDAVQRPQWHSLVNFTAVGNMITARANHIAVLLPNGKVLIAGGEINGFPSQALVSAELSHP